MEIPILNQIKFLGIRPLKEGESNPNALKILEILSRRNVLLLRWM